MRHPHGLRAAAAAGLLAPGAAYEGGFFAGYISHTANGIPTHALIVAPAATGVDGGKQSKTTSTTTAGTTSTYDGAANTAAMVTAGIALHPAAQFCTGLSIGGYTDWYLPAINELEIAYYNLKPTTDSNINGYGINTYSVPARGTGYTAGTPAQTSVAAFQSGGAEAFVAANHFSSTEALAFPSQTSYLVFSNGRQSSTSKAAYNRVRAFRKLAL